MNNSKFRFSKFLLNSLIVSLILINNIQAEQKGKYEEGKVYRHQLKNGLTVLTMERHIAPLIYQQLTYKVGSRNERLGITGISHVVEHMMFKGTKKYGKGEASKIISQNSGIFNAFTANDMTSYYEYMPKNKIEIAFDIESDRMQNANFNPDEFKSEIEVIIQERRMRSESSSQGVLREAMNSLMFTSHPNRDPIIGWPNDLRTMTREDAYAYYKTYYTPNNAFLVLVGDFETDEILKLADKYYGAVPRGPEVKDITVFQEPQRVKKTLTFYHSDFSTPSIRMAFHVPTYQDPDAPALRVAGMILCEKSRDARLYKRMVEQGQLASSVAGGFGMAKDPTVFQISAGVKQDSSIERVEQIIWEEIKKMQTEPVTDHELQKIKNRYKYNQVTSYLKNGDVGSRISRYEAFFGWDYFGTFDKQVNEVTKEDIMRVMNKYFVEDGVNIAYMFPKEGEKKKKVNNGEEEKTEEDFENLYNSEPEKFYFKTPLSETENLIPEVSDISNVLMIAKKLTEEISEGDLFSAEEKNDEIIKPQPIAPLIKTFKLDNGITIQTIENHLVPTISVVGIIETGYIPETLEGKQPGIAVFLGDVMSRGTKELSYKELSERLAFVPFSFNVSGSHRGFYFQGSSLTENADEMMQTGRDMVLFPPLRNEDIEKLRAPHLMSARNRYKKTGIKAFYTMFNTLMGDHPITKYNSTEEGIKSIKREDLEKLYKKYFTPKNLTILMIGDMSAEAMRDLANKYYGDWKNEDGITEIPKTPPVGDYNQKIIKVFPDKDYKESTINIGFKVLNNLDVTDDEIISVLNYILASSALTSRIGVELRDKQGLIYGIKSEVWNTSDNFGYWKFNTKTGPENTGKVIKGIFSEIKKLLKDGITDEELAAAKNRQIGLLPFYIETPDDVAQIIFDSIKEKRPFDHFDKKGDRILSVTKEDVMRIAKKYFTLDAFYIVVDGPLEEKSLDHLVGEL